METTLNVEQLLEKKNKKSKGNMGFRKTNKSIKKV